MKTIILFLMILSRSMFLSGQHIRNDIYQQDPHIQLGDSYYGSDLNGLTYMMNDLQTTDSVLYTQLYPKFQTLQNKKKMAITGLVIGAGAGLVTGIVALNNTENLISLSLLSGVFTLTGGLLYGINMVRYTDVLNFTNEFNRKSTGDKILLTVRPKVNFINNTSGGVSLSLRF